VHTENFADLERLGGLYDVVEKNREDWTEQANDGLCFSLVLPHQIIIEEVSYGKRITSKRGRV